MIQERRKRKNIEKAIDEQNNDITDFLHSETRSFYTKATNKQKFTEEEMLALIDLSDPTNPQETFELQNLKSLLNPLR